MSKPQDNWTKSVGSRDRLLCSSSTVALSAARLDKPVRELIIMDLMPDTQLSDEGAYHSEVNHFFRARMEVTMPSFPQDIQYNQTVDKYQ